MWKIFYILLCHLVGLSLLITVQDLQFADVDIGKHILKDFTLPLSHSQINAGSFLKHVLTCVSGALGFLIRLYWGSMIQQLLKIPLQFIYICYGMTNRTHRWICIVIYLSWRRRKRSLECPHDIPICDDHYSEWQNTPPQPHTPTHPSPV